MGFLPSYPQKKLKELIENAVKKREPLFRFSNALRLVNSSGDSLPGVTVDQYHKHFLVQFFLPSSFLYKDFLTIFLKERFNPEYLICKERISPDGRSLDSSKVDIVVNDRGSQTAICEHGLKFKVDLNDTIQTGLFLDMRANRLLIGRLAKGKDVLNCFSYTCSFGVYARSFKASRVINVDISQKALNKGRENYKINGLEEEGREFTQADCLVFLRRASKSGKKYDIIILDPPSFARYKGKIFHVNKNLAELINLALTLLKSKGFLLVSTNFSELTPPKLNVCIKTSLQKASRKLIKEEFLGQDKDFPGSGTMKESFLSAWLLQIA